MDDIELEEYRKQEKKFGIQAERNLRGIELEKQGNIAEAIDLYEENVAEGFEGNHPYNRLSILYRKQGKIEDEIRVLQNAIKVYEAIKSRSQWGDTKKLDKFKKRLESIKSKYNINELYIKPYKKRPNNDITKEALLVLQTRYVKGEITREEFLQMKKDIEG